MYESSMELTMLMWASILYVVQVMIGALAADLQNGIPWGLGNREVRPAVDGWGGRAQRAYVNMAENLLPFACLVLIAYSLDRTGEMSVLGAEIFLVSRLAYAVLYVAGVKVLRSLAYFGGVAGMVLIVVQLFSG
jgi:uncharacterized MAPEG superfamily protein